MALRQQASRSMKKRINKLRRSRGVQKQQCRPLLETLESRMLMTGFWTPVQPTNPNSGPLAGTQTMQLLSNGVVMVAQNTAPNPGANAGAYVM